MKVTMITTIDNPFDPFEDFEKWFLFDVEKGYNSCAYLDRMAKTSDSFTDKENAEEIERAINRIIELDFMNVYTKITKEIDEEILYEKKS